MAGNIIVGVIVFIIGVIFGLLIAWFYWRQRLLDQETRIQSLINKGAQSLGVPQGRSQARDRSSPQAGIIPATGAAAVIMESVPDDLKRIEGIGPKISGILNEAGITSFSQLAASSVSQLDQIVREAGITIADPSTWPEQAILAAAGDWESLQGLQGRLKGGRRV